jgi:3'(2'), 5'-bisphosphate nucleotidase
MLQEETNMAVESVRRASRLCRAVQAELGRDTTLAKGDRSPVTVADYGAQALVILALREAFPDLPFVAEESTGLLRTEEGRPIREQVVRHVRALVPDASDEEILGAIDRGDHPGGPRGRHWTLDPIDGTRGFLRKDQYAVALALIEDGEVVLGVLGCPNLPLDSADPEGERGCLFSAVRGGGTRMTSLDGSRETPVRVADVRDVTRASFCESVESAHSSHGDSARVAERLGVTAPPFRIDSQCKYAAVARGDAAIYLRLPTRKDYEEKIWDHAAGWIVVTEAGGRVTDVDGAPLDFSLGKTLRRNKGVIVTNGAVHDETIAAVREVLGR